MDVKVPYGHNHASGGQVSVWEIHVPTHGLSEWMSRIGVLDRPEVLDENHAQCKSYSTTGGKKIAIVFTTWGPSLTKKLTRRVE